MRLVCPNCGAQYEVDDRVIPESGRDVQCSACGHAWYQMPAGREDAGAAEEAAVDEQLLEDEAGEAELPEPELEEAAAPAETGKPQPRGIDDGVRSILQEEAERELEARASEQPHEPEQVETQPDLGLDAGPSADEERRRVARERMARMRGTDEEEAREPDFDAHAEPGAEAAEPAAHGRDLFPDIEEINSTLDRHGPGEEIGGEGGVAPAKSTSGFRRGFMAILLLAILLLALYLLAPLLAEKVPALKPALTAYVEAINAARAWLDTMLRGLIEKIEAIAGEG
jgi:predicted Zn finger-like uncharacterized protein